jgi:hypothetical protein
MEIFATKENSIEMSATFKDRAGRGISEGVWFFHECTRRKVIFKGQCRAQGR